MANLKKIDPAPPPPPVYELSLTEDELQVVIVAVGYLSPSLLQSKLGTRYKDKSLTSVYNAIKDSKKG